MPDLPAAIASSYRQRGLRTRFTLLFYLITLGSVGAVGYFGYDSASQAYRSKATELVAGYTNETAHQIDNLQALVRNNLDFLSGDQSLLRYNYWRDMGDTERQAEALTEFSNQLRAFAANYRYVYKIRFIDTAGHEVLGVKRDLRSEQVSIVAERQQLRKEEADYFLRGMELAKGEYYASPLSPNTEQGQIEKPLVPVVRFVAPVIGANNTRYGMVVITVLAEAYFTPIRQANAIDPSRRFYLITGEGTYLFHPAQEKTMAAVTATALAQEPGSAASFNNDFPGLLDQIAPLESQQTLDRHGYIMSFLHIHPNAGRHENGFIFVGMADEVAALAELRNFVLFFIVLLAAVVAIVMFASRAYIGGLMRPLEAITRQLQRLGRGETGGEDIDYRAEDEIGRMVDSSRKLMLNMERLATQADVISGGDFSGSVPLLSEQDRLGQAINNMTAMLRDARSEEQRSNWLKDGVSEMNRVLSGDLNAPQLADAAISLLGRTLDAGRGVFYVYQKDNEQLELLGSYMFSEREALGNRFKLGEGAVGQVARERKPIILHASGTTSVPVAPIVTGTLCQPPQHTYTYPLLREGELLGVIELASFEHFDTLRQEFIARAADVMASFLYIVEQREQIRRLLQIAEVATRDAQEQSRQLQLTNAQMEEQQQQLRQQTVELQATNSLMEEQQQQLQQQTAELQATNAQMEEQQQQLQQQSAELQASNSQMEEAQLQLEERNRDLLRSQEELDARAKQLELSSQYKSEFLANMSHELRTPLNSIILLAKMMASNEDHKLGEEEVKRADVIHRAGRDLLRLINDVLDLSKVEAGRMELHSAPIASSVLVEEFQDLFSAPAGDKGLELKVEDTINADLVVDRDKLSQIVRNLLSNAIKFTRQGSVTLRFERRPGEALPLHICVSDTGIGVAADKQKLIFEAFQQADGSTSREYGGTGLGLSISRSFALLMGGRIELASSPGQGSTFTLLLPDAPPSLSDSAAPAPLSSARAPNISNVPPAAPLHPLAPPAPWPNDDRERIGGNDSVLLLIDDDPVFAQAILDINRRLGYKTLLAASGGDGLELVRRFNPNGILLDLGLPDMDGSAVLHQIKSTPALAEIPVYIISGRDRDNALLGQGALGYLHKPVDAEQITRVEAEVLARCQADAGRDILLLTNGALNATEIAPLVGQEGSQLVTLSVADVSADKLAEWAATDGVFRFAILDLGVGSAALAEARRVAGELHARLPQLGLLFYSAAPLGDEDEARLRQFSDSIIVKAPQSTRRLQENIAHFLQAAPPRRRSHPLPAEPQGSGKKRLAGSRILVVDDDARNLFVITAALEQHGAQVDNALNGRKALQMLQTLRPDLVLMDIMMPEMDGYQTIAAMRADPRLATIPVLALTAKALPSDREKALAAGADDYLAKPADYEVLVNMAAAWCQGRR
jgi:signal transduction histidine kinase/CheY-like chemotaxis protein